MGEVSSGTHVTGRDGVRLHLRELHRVLGTWRAVGAQIGVSAGTVCRVAKGGYWPKRKAIRERLVQRRPRKPRLCPKCGEPVG